jgi:hypothetical protein
MNRASSKDAQHGRNSLDLGLVLLFLTLPAAWHCNDFGGHSVQSDARDTTSETGLDAFNANDPSSSTPSEAGASSHACRSSFVSCVKSAFTSVTSCVNTKIGGISSASLDCSRSLRACRESDKYQGDYCDCAFINGAVADLIELLEEKVAGAQDCVSGISNRVSKSCASYYPLTTEEAGYAGCVADYHRAKADCIAEQVNAWCLEPLESPFCASQALQACSHERDDMHDALQQCPIGFAACAGHCS